MTDFAYCQYHIVTEGLYCRYESSGFCIQLWDVFVNLWKLDYFRQQDYITLKTLSLFFLTTAILMLDIS